MPSFRLSRRAEADLDQIFEFTVERFGLRQAERYLEGMRHCFSMLAENPRMGRPAASLGKGVRRHEHQSHVILYELVEGGINVLAVVHGRRAMN